MAERSPIRQGTMHAPGRTVLAAQLPQHQRQIAGMLHKHLGARHDLDDLVQTVYLEALQTLPRFRGDSSLGAFVGGITMMVIRRARRGTTWDRRKTPLEQDYVSRAPSPESTALAREQLRRVRIALRKVKRPKREAFIRWSVDGVSTKAIARDAQVSLSATRSRIFHARTELCALARADAYLNDLVS